MKLFDFVWKLNHTDTSPWHYVQSHTDYGSDGPPTTGTDQMWGNAKMVTEDYGSGTDPITGVAYINRITQTPTYDYTGRALTTIDGMGRQFVTVYDLDGRVQTVTRTDGTTQPIVTYTYGTTDGYGYTGLTNGVVTSVVDGLSGVQQNFAYNAAGTAAAGQMGSVTEINGNDSYTVSYLYDPQSDVSVKKYHIPTTPGASTYNDTEWQFSSYISFGLSGNRVPLTLNQLASTDGGATWNPTSEEFDYAYDMAGRLIEATFAVTPQTGQTGYSAAWPAGTRGRALYQYDPGGRLVNLQHYWDTWVPPTDNLAGYYQSTPILGNSCVYDPVKNQKIESDFWSVDPATGTWKTTPDRAETYQYDPDTNYLTRANYGDGLPNAVQNWTYDAAGNRASDDSNPGSWAYDALNRMTASPGLTYTNDLAGNRLTRSDSVGYGWDALNQMASYSTSGATTSYVYRTDGMRVSKASSSSNERFRHDGQMGLADDIAGSGGSSETIYTLGARSIDSIITNGSVSYPMFDIHGDVVARVVRSGLNSFSVSGARAFDAWGVIRQGSMGGAPDQRYCGRAGHRQDDESGLTYMRARYYEPFVGRFVSQDSDRHGVNYFAYASCDPINRFDSNGKDDVSVGWAAFAAFFVTFLYESGHKDSEGRAALAGLISAVSTAVIVKGSNVLGQAEELSALYVIGIKVFGGGFVNAVAEFMIDVVTGDSPGGDIGIAFLAGGFGTLVPGTGGPYDAGFGAVIGGLADAASSIAGSGGDRSS